MQQSINKHLKLVDYYVGFDLFTDDTLVKWLEPFVLSINSNGAIPYLLDKKKYRFRASPLASTIIWMDKAGLLPESAIESMQNRLLYLRDNNEPDDEHPGETKKNADDNDGWSLGEGVSVWSTSMAIIAMIDRNGIGLKKANEFKASVLWLAKQKHSGNNGWGYQRSSNCQENIITTSLAIRAISLALKHTSEFGFTSEERDRLEQAVSSGFTYIINNKKEQKDEIYWCFDGKKSCAATTWALIALKELQDLSLNQKIKSYYSTVIEGGRKSIINCIPKKQIEWENELIVKESGAVYGSMKNYYSFSATLLIDAFELGISPFNIRIINQIKWLLENNKKWTIEQYSKESTCTFTYAMVLSTITKWASLVGNENAVRLIHAPLTRTNRVFRLIFGYTVLNNSPAQIVDKTRTLFTWLISIMILFMLLERNLILGKIHLLVSQYIFKDSATINTIFINLLSNGLFTIIWAIILGIANKLSKTLTRRFIE